MGKNRYNKVNENVVAILEDLLGQANVITEKRSIHNFAYDVYSLEDFQCYPEIVVKPKCTEQISRIVTVCSQEKIPLVPRGGGTGLCAGCVPVHEGIVVTFENMDKILEIDKKNLMATAEAGVRLSSFYSTVEGEGLFFPPHPGDESATIGGVIATNAGGARAVKYGVVRNFIKGLEVVLPDGEIVWLGGKFIKSSSGYNLKHLIIGSEGTLGIVTKAIISLIPPPRVILTLVAPFHHLQDAIDTVPDIIKSKIIPTAIEFVDLTTIQLSAKNLCLQWPFSQGNAHLIMILDGGSFEEVVAQAEGIGNICKDHQAIDVMIADSQAKQRDILKIRSCIYDSVKSHTLEILDIAVPPAEIACFVNEITKVAEEFNSWLPTYGHAADGNVHTHIMKSRWDGEEWKEIRGWQENVMELRKTIHDIGLKYKGACSGEHGIGMVKKAYLKSFLGEKQIALMKMIKKSFDPHLIMNPGKIFDIE